MASKAPSEFEDCFRLEYGGIVRTCYLLVRDRGAAEDLAQEAFVRLFIHWRRIADYESPGAWVRRVAIRLCIDALRRGRLAARLWFRARPDVGSETRHDAVDRAIASLSPKQQAAIVLHYFEDRSVGEIAAVLECNVSTAKVHLHRARKKLQLLLSDMEMRDVV
jgi:RNA polymerase sigma-70 factor, ECF subfamily